MKFYEFNLLPENEQTEVVLGKVDFVADRQDNDSSILLDQLFFLR